MTANQIARDARWKYRDFPSEPIVISNVEYACVRVTGLTSRRPLEIGGFQDEPEITISVSNIDLETGGCVFSTLPEVGTVALFGGENYRIDRIEEDSFSSDVLMDLRSPSK